MLRILKFLLGKREIEPLPAEVVELNSALDRLRAAFRSRTGGE